MVLILAGFFLGLMVFPFLYACISSLAASLADKKRYKASAGSRLSISKALRKEIQAGMEPTDRLGWMNALIQRMYRDMTQNYHFENGIRHNIMKSFSAAAGYGLAKNIKIKHLDFGAEAPYLRSIRLISREEYNLLAKQSVNDLRSCAEQISLELGKLDGKCLSQSEEACSQCTGSSLYSNKTINFSSLTDLADEKLHGMSQDDSVRVASEENLGKQPMSATKEDPGDDGKHQVEKDRDPPSKTTNEENAAVNGIIGSVHNEISRRCLLDSGTVEFSTEELGKINLQDTYRNCTFMGHLVYNGCIKMTVEMELPKGVVISAAISVKRAASDFLFRIPAENYTTRCEITLINNPLIEIEVESGVDAGYGKALFQSSTSNLLKRLALCIIKSTIVYPSWYPIVQPFASSPRSVSFYPTKVSVSNIERACSDGERIMTIIGCDFKIVSQKADMFYRKSFTMLNDKSHVSMWDFPVPTHFPGPCRPPYEGLSSRESKLLYLFETFEVFRGIIPGFKEARQVTRKKNVSIVRMLVYSSEIEFVRVVYKSHVVFYKNSDMCEFFVFRIQEGRLQIFSFTDAFGLCLSDKRVERLRVKIYSVGDSKQQAEGGATDSEDSELYHRRVELESMFKRLLCVSNGDFCSYAISVSIRSKKLREYLKEDCLRLRMLSESIQVIRSFNESRNIKTLVVKGPDALETTLHSLFSKRFIIDVCPNEQIVLVYKISRSENEDRSETSKTRMQILYRSTFKVKFPNYFVESLRIRESYQKYFNVSDKIDYSVSSSQMQKEVCVSRGTVYFEFGADVEDCFHLTLFSCKRQKVLLEVPRVVSSRVFRLIYPVENDYVRISLVPKHKKNEAIKYKMVSFSHPKNVLVDGVVCFDRNHKFKVSMEGSHAHVIFWEKEWNSELKSYIHDNENKTAVSNCGILRSEEKAYTLIHKNTSAKRASVHIFAGLTELG